MIQILALLTNLALAQVSTTSVALADFDRYCSTLDGAPAIEARLKAGGWAPFEANPTSEVGRLVAAIKVVPSPDFQVAARVFRTSPIGPIILVSQMTAPDGSGSLECKHIDEMAPVPTTAALQDWAGSMPEMSKKAGAITWGWKPGRGNAHWTAVVYVKPGSKPRFPGVGVIATSVRFN